ncbi:hypothetical protein [Cellulomonas soli]
MPPAITSKDDARLVTFTGVPTVEESRVFPERTVRHDEPRPGRAVLAVVLGVPFGPMVVWFDPAEPAVATVCAATPLIKSLRPAPPAGP